MKAKSQKGTKPKDPFAFFKEATAEGFGFLTSDFDFELVSVIVRLPECAIKYQNETTGVIITYEWESIIWIDLARLVRGPEGVSDSERYSLDSLILERCPTRNTSRHYSSTVDWSNDHIERTLRAYANDLKECGREILQGDFGIFPALEQRTAEIIRRKSSMLYGE